MSRQPIDRGGFHFAIICALPLEHDAVYDSFDEAWPNKDYGKAPGDPNLYVTGLMGELPVVLLLLPGMGKSEAASAAASLRSSYPNLILALVVGVCGAIPYLSDDIEVILGDVIISKYVVRYDFGRQYPDEFVPKRTIEDIPGRPTKEMRAISASLETAYRRDKLEEEAQSFLGQLQEKIRNTKHQGKYDYPGTLHDRLFEPYYRHKHYKMTGCDICAACRSDSDPVCESSFDLKCADLGCSDKNLVRRTRLQRQRHSTQTDNRTGPELALHMGGVGSADTVMRSARIRDKISRRDKVIGFDMEGAGVWDELPSCLIIKGVCDYADSHKSKGWQKYAAATAASTAKALLRSHFKGGQSAAHAGSRQGSSNGCSTLCVSTSGQAKTISGPVNSYTAQTANRDEILGWISTFDYQKLHRVVRKEIPHIKHTSKCGSWLLKSELFKSWEEQGVDRIWYIGNPGAGKSVLASIIIEHLKASTQGSESDQVKKMVAYFYFSYTASSIDVKDVLGSVLRQFQQISGIHAAVKQKFEEARKIGRFRDDKQPGSSQEIIRNPTENELKWMLKEFGKGRRMFIVLDALDEFDYEHRESLLNCLKAIGPHVKILVTSRVLQHLQDLQKDFAKASIEAHEEDMDEYVTSEFKNCAIRNISHMHKVIREEVKRKSGKMFILLRLHMKAICEAETQAEVEDVLESLPEGSIHEAYKTTMHRIKKWSEAKQARAISILGWVSFSHRLLTIAELQHSLAIMERRKRRKISGPLTKLLRKPEDITSFCCGLIMVDSEDMVRFIHSSAAEFFNKNPDIFPNFDKQATFDCVDYLIIAASACLRAVTPSDSNAVINADDLEKEYPLTQYAGKFLHRHHRKIRNLLADKDVSDVIESFVIKKQNRELYSYLLLKYKAYDSKSIIFDDKETLDITEGRSHTVFDQLQIAVYLGNPRVVQTVVDQGADINVVDTYGRMPLDVAIDCGLDSIACILLESGANVDLRTEKGHLVLLHAIERDYSTTVEQVLGPSILHPPDEHGPSILDKPDDSFFKVVGLVLWIVFAQLEALREFLLKTFPTTSTSRPQLHEDLHSETVLPDKCKRLLQLAYDGNVCGLRKLLSPGGRDSIDATLLAQESSDIESDLEESEPRSRQAEPDGSQYNHLLSRGAELEKLFLRTACFLAAENGKHAAVCTFLDHGVSPNLKNLRGQSLLHRATYRDNYKLVDVLLKRDADANQRDRQGRSALTAYADLKREKVLNLLLNKKADIDLKQSGDSHEIYEAATFGADAAVEFFLQHGVNPSITNYFGWTPLHSAAANGHVKIVKLLVEKGANISPLSDTDKTPLDLVEQGEKHYDRTLTGWDHYGAEVTRSQERDLATWATSRDNIASYLRENGANTSYELFKNSRNKEEFQKLLYTYP